MKPYRLLFLSAILFVFLGIALLLMESQSKKTIATLSHTQVTIEDVQYDFSTTSSSQIIDFNLTLNNTSDFNIKNVEITFNLYDVNQSFIEQVTIKMEDEVRHKLAFPVKSSILSSTRTATSATIDHIDFEYTPFLHSYRGYASFAGIISFFLFAFSIAVILVKGLLVTELIEIENEYFYVPLIVLAFPALIFIVRGLYHTDYFSNLFEWSFLFFSFCIMGFTYLFIHGVSWVIDHTHYF